MEISAICWGGGGHVFEGINAEPKANDTFVHLDINCFFSPVLIRLPVPCGQLPCWDYRLS